MLHYHGIQRVFCYDEARFGLKAHYRRRWCPSGYRAEWVVEDRYEWLWLLMATEPSTGECVCAYMPTINTETITAFLQEFDRQYPKDQHPKDQHPKDRIGIVLDGHAAHRSKRLQIPSHLVLLPTPAYSPEVNPAERVFKELRARLSNIVFDSLASLEAALTSALSLWWHTPALLQRLTSYPWWCEAAHSIKTSFL